MKKEILILSSIGIVALIIGGSIFGSQLVKQNSIKKYQKAELEIKEMEMRFSMEQELKAEADKASAKLMINACIKDAENSYWNYAELNGTGKRYDADGVTMAQYKWDIAEDKKEKDIDNCYRKYNQ